MTKACVEYDLFCDIAASLGATMAALGSDSQFTFMKPGQNVAVDEDDTSKKKSCKFVEKSRATESSGYFEKYVYLVFEMIYCKYGVFVQNDHSQNFFFSNLDVFLFSMSFRKLVFQSLE